MVEYRFGRYLDSLQLIYLLFCTHLLIQDILALSEKLDLPLPADAFQSIPMGVGATERESMTQFLEDAMAIF